MSLIKVKTGWRRLEGLDAWKAEFSTLLQEASAAASKEAAAPRLEIAAYLAGFIQESFPQDDAMDALDELARQMAEDILRSTIDERLAAIASRTAEYVQIEKDIARAAENASAAAESVRLTGVVRFIDAASDAITSAKALAETLDTSKVADQKLATQIEETIVAVAKLRTAAARLV